MWTVNRMKEEEEEAEKKEEIMRILKKYEQ